MYGCLRFRVWGLGFRVKAQNPKTQTMSFGITIGEQSALDAASAVYGACGV